MVSYSRQIVADFVRTINTHDAAAFIALFADSAVVKDAGEEYSGVAAIKLWSEREIFEPLVTLEVLNVADHDGVSIVTAKVDGTFDKTGLPDPLILEHRITFEGDKITEFASRLADEQSGK